MKATVISKTKTFEPYVLDGIVLSTLIFGNKIVLTVKGEFRKPDEIYTTSYNLDSVQIQFITE